MKMKISKISWASKILCRDKIESPFSGTFLIHKGKVIKKWSFEVLIFMKISEYDKKKKRKKENVPSLNADTEIQWVLTDELQAAVN